MADKKKNDKKTEKDNEKDPKVETNEEVKEELQEEDSVSKEEEQREPTLEEKYVQVVQELALTKDKWLRTVAEFENFRRRSTIEKSTWIKNATERLVLQLCDVVDNFERALLQKHDNGKSYEKGIKLIYKQLLDLLTKEGVKKIEALNEDFDPKYHEALSKIPSEEEEDKIVAVIQNGYIMNEKIIRAARVAVSNGEKPQKKKKKK